MTWPRSLSFLLAVAATALGVVLALGRTSDAEEKSGHTVYLSIQGEGATAKAWYRGAPPTGTAVQDALDALSREGYRVVTTSPSVRPSTLVGGNAPSSPLVPEQTWVVLLEKR